MTTPFKRTPWTVALVIAATLASSGCAVVGSLRGPQISGDKLLTGLSAPVRVLRDAHGIPYIFAANTPDLIRAQGFVTAQHRLFQMEGYRAMATGRLAEAVGAVGLNNDRQIRLIGLRRNAERHAKLLSPDARNFLAWYAEGMNAYITAHANDHPRELQLAGFSTRPWTLEDMVTVLHYVNWSQAANFKSELTMQKLIDKFGAERTLRELSAVNVNPLRQQQVIRVGDAPHTGSQSRAGLAEPPVQTPVRATDAIPLGEVQLLAGLAEEDGLFAPQAPVAVGSNNWAIGKSRSASGAAVLVNDPHLDARLLPGIWHPVGLFTPEIQAVGAALPAVPGILLGRTSGAAFGVTNAYGDSQDLFIERVAPGQPDHYVDGDRVRPFQIIDELIRIKDANAPGGFREETLRIRATVRGPIISGPILNAEGERLLSLRMASAEIMGGDIGIDRLLTARSAAEVDRAAQALDTMYFNLVFADKAGVIGHRATGRVPVRASLQGAVPKLVGSAGDWQGFIPADQMPGTLAPARDWVGTANHDTRPDVYAYDYSSHASASYRIRRMIEVLDSARGMRSTDQSALMMDTKNLQASRLKPVLLAALRADPAHAEVARLIEAWDGRDDQHLGAPLIHHAFYERLAYETFVDEMGEKLAREWLNQWYAWQERFDEMIQTPESPWFDDIRTPQKETLPDLARRTASAVVALLREKQGPDPSKWTWGNAHRVTFSSPLRRTGLGRDLLGAAPAPMSGSGATLMRSGNNFLGDFSVQWFASARLVADLGDDDKLEAVVSGGVVDRQFHPHQKDQLPAWSEGRLLNWWFARDKVEANARSMQRLVPR
jgi:penicillin G amidase